MQVNVVPTEADLEAERRSMAAAMAVSLEEEEFRKAAELPLKEWKDDDLLERFKSSAILAEVPPVASHSSLDSATFCVVWTVVLKQVFRSEEDVLLTKVPATLLRAQSTWNWRKSPWLQAVIDITHSSSQKRSHQLYFHFGSTILANPHFGR